MTANYMKLVALGAAVTVLGLASQARATDYTWTPSATGTYNWVNSGQNNWGTGTGGAFPNAASDTANITTDVSGTGGFTIRLGQPITLGGLTLGDLNGSHAMAISNATVGGTVTPSNTLTFATVAEGGTAVFNLGAAGTVGNTVSATLNIGGTSTLNINALGGQAVTMSGGAVVNANQTLLFTGGVNAANIASITGDLSGNGTVVVQGTGGVTIVGTKTFTGSIILNDGNNGSSNSGAMTATTGSIKDAASLTINGAVTVGISQQGGVWHAGNSATAANNPGQRMTSNTIVLNSGTLEAVGQTATVGVANPWQQGLEWVEETTANLNVNSGYSILASTSATTTQGTKLNFTNINRSAGTVLFIRANGLGATTVGSRVLINAGNANSLLVGAGGAEGTATMSIIPWLLVNATGANTHTPIGFVTYGSTPNGNTLRALGAGETVTSIATVTPGGNYDVSSVNIGANRSINSIRFSSSSGSNIGSGLTLTVASGGVYMSNSGGSIGIAGDAAAGTLAFGSAEGVISVGANTTSSNNTGTIGAAITGSGGLTKGATGTLVLAGNNSGLTGNTHVAGGTLRVGDGTNHSTLANDGFVRVHNGATLEISTGSADAIDDDQAVYLDDFGIYNGKLLLNTGINETVGALYFGSVLQAAGTWGATGSGAAHIDDTFFSGSGVLSVVPVPEPTSAALIGLAGAALLRRRRRD